VTIESALPWLSAVAAIGAAGLAGGAPARREDWLKAVALGALAVFAYFRWIAPAAIPLSLTLQAVGEAALPRGAERWRSWRAVFPIASWLVLANLFWSSGEGNELFVTDAIKAGLLALLLVGAGLGVRRARSVLVSMRIGGALAAASVVLMAAMALTLDWALWPALAGAGAIAGAEALRLMLAEQRSAWTWKGLWTLQFAGYGAVSYAFLR